MLTDAWSELRPHRLQALLWRTRARYIAAACGRGSGKTELARRRVIRYLPVKKSWPDPLYFYALPTYKQARRVAWRPILNLIPKDWIKGRPNEVEMRIDTIFGSTLHVVGMDQPARIEGTQWDGGVIDESCDIKPGAFARSVLPALAHRNGWCWRIGVPKRVGVGAQEFKEFCKSGAPPGTSWRDSTCMHESYSWPSEDILTEEQLSWPRANLDPRDYNEQYRACWETVGGLVFYAFDEVLNISDQIAYNPELPLVIGSDFNVDPMAWIIGQINGTINFSTGEDTRKFLVFDELWMRNTNTKEALTRLAEKYSGHTNGFNFFGDATSRSRNTRASESDYIQIRNDNRFNSARIFYPRTNPKKANRFASCNALFCNAEGVRRFLVHPRCKNLIRDLNTRAYKEGTTEVDDYGDVGHITDALGYAIYKIFPMKIVYESTPEVFIQT